KKVTMGLAKESKKPVSTAKNGHTSKNGHAAKNPANRKKASNGHTNGYQSPTYEDSSLLDDKDLLRILLEVRNGNFTVRMPVGEVGVKGRVYDTLNEIISLNEEMMREFTKAGNTIGKQGKLTQRIEVPNAKGSWAPGVGSLNSLLSTSFTRRSRSLT